MKTMIKFVLALLAVTALICGISNPTTSSKCKGIDSLAQTSMPYPKPIYTKPTTKAL